MAEGGDRSENLALPPAEVEEPIESPAQSENSLNPPLIPSSIRSNSAPDAFAGISDGARLQPRQEPRRHSDESVRRPGNEGFSVSMQPEPREERYIELNIEPDLSWLAQFNVQIHPSPELRSTRAFLQRRRHRSANTGPRVYLLRDNSEEQNSERPQSVAARDSSTTQYFELDRHGNILEQQEAPTREESIDQQSDESYKNQEESRQTKDDGQ